MSYSHFYLLEHDMLMIADVIERFPRTEDTFIQTFTGRKFWPLNPDAADVCIEDLAHALSQTCRFTGHTRTTYSVAEHSVRVSETVQSLMMTRGLDCNPRVALWALLHDASEAYLHDLPIPIKGSPHLGSLYRAYEALVMEAVIERFSLYPIEPPIVKEADGILLATEKRDLMNGSHPDGPYAPLPDVIDPWSTQLAEGLFLQRFRNLTGGSVCQKV